MSAPGPVAPTAQFITLHGHQFRYWRWGTDGPTTVLVHGTGFHGYVWSPIAAALGRDRQVLALDQRGHGDSYKPQSGYGWEVFAHDLHAFLTTLCRDGIDAVGHSAGATAIARCAAQHPGVIRRAVLIDPILFPRPPDGPATENPLAHRARKRRMVWHSRDAMFESYRIRPPFNTWRPDVLWAYIEEGTRQRADGQVELKCPSAIEAEIFEHAPRHDGFSLLPRIDIPVLLLRGAHSEAFPPPSAAHALSLLPQAQLQTLPETTHFLPMEQPDMIAQAVREFFGL